MRLRLLVDPTSVNARPLRPRQTCSEGFEHGVTSPFAQNCTLCGAQGERFGDGAERSQSVSRPAGIPVVITGETDVLPSERRDMGEQLV